jgi:hypothetical protein
MYVVVVNEDNILRELLCVTKDAKIAEDHFLSACKTNISNWDQYNEADRDAVLEDAFAQYGNCAVVLMDVSNVKSDDEICAELGGFPPKQVQKIERWVQSGEIGEVATIDEAIERAAGCLDAACSWDICGPVLFQAEDGNWYVITVEAVTAKAHSQYVKETLAEMPDEL